MRTSFAIGWFYNEHVRKVVTHYCLARRKHVPLLKERTSLTAVTPMPASELQKRPSRKETPWVSESACY